jgi:thymidylate synthase
MYPSQIISSSQSETLPLGHTIKADSIWKAYKEALTYIAQNGIDFKDQRSDEMKTVYNLMITINRPLYRLDLLDDVHKAGVLQYNRTYLDQYAEQLIGNNLVGKSCRDKSDLDFEYSYPDRLRRRWSRLSKKSFETLENLEVTDSEYLDQISEVIKILNKDSNSRRAVCTTWIPSVDLKKENVPCMNWLVFWKLNGYLHASIGFRSHDVFGAYPANVYGISRLMEYIANRTNSRMGSLTTISVNGHYNKLFEEDVKKVVNYK